MGSVLRVSFQDRRRARPLLKSGQSFAWRFSHASRPAHGMLQAMQQPAETRVLPRPASFAGLLAALAAPAQSRSPASLAARSEGLLPRNDDGLEDDVATLSYERALRAHPRYGSAGATDQSLTQCRHI